MVAETRYNKHLDGQNVGELRRWLLPVVDPSTAPAADIVSNGMPVKGSAGGLWIPNDAGTAYERLTTASDLTGSKPYRGTLDASAGIPTAAGSTVRPGEAIEAGDFWRVTTAGSIAGLQGLDDLEVGDLVYADADDANAAAQFYSVQANLNPAAGNLKASTVNLASLPANTVTDVLPTAGDALATITDVEIYDGTEKVTEAYAVHVDNATPKATVESLIAKTNLTFVFTGA